MTARRRTCPYRVADLGKLSPVKPGLCAVERTEQISADPLLRGYENRAPLTDRADELAFATDDGPTLLLSGCL
jgi:hypothetical protein